MLLFHQSSPLQSWLARQRDGEARVGFVPTMGALHEGHLSLVRAAREKAEIVVCSIFVNPTQFNDPADFEHYPVTLDQDIALLADAGADAVFLPDVAVMYPEGLEAAKKHSPYDFGRLEKILEGKYRPGHFQGVGQVMHRLLDIVQPDLLFMGQKDYQQCMVISRLINLLNIKVKLITCPTLREPGGLAMSSRNRRLSPEQRRQAVLIHDVLQDVKKHIADTAPPVLCRRASGRLEAAGFEVDYVAIADAETLEPLEERQARPMIALIAAKTGNVRLIDNMRLD
ncbi:pantoate--beta-alanine ligase [Compostibacter hankyongensis]|uniref:Pantothenate synthetase n=1 Tax=Compostibacter hankyongensis TaxID=1007089 RepID=A0ABP8FKU7_9BACT